MIWIEICLLDWSYMALCFGNALWTWYGTVSTHPKGDWTISRWIAVYTCQAVRTHSGLCFASVGNTNTLIGSWKKQNRIKSKEETAVITFADVFLEKKWPCMMQSSCSCSLLCFLVSYFIYFSRSWCLFWLTQVCSSFTNIVLLTAFLKLNTTLIPKLYMKKKIPLGTTKQHLVPN